MISAGIAVVSRADEDGHPVGQPTQYIGPFLCFQDYERWKDETYGIFLHGVHVVWQALAEPPGTS